jgi:hypothetical protein
MRIEDFKGAYYADNPRQIDAILHKRNDDGLNEFWIWRGEQKHPVMGLLVRNDLACLNYFPRERHPGFASVGNLPSLNPRGETDFWAHGAPMPVINWKILPFADALRAIHEFRVDPGLPNSIRWFEL